MVAGAASEAELTVRFSMDDDRQLVTAVEPAALAAGESATIQAALVDAAGQVLISTGSNVTLTIEDPEGGRHPLPLVDNGSQGYNIAGDGIFTTTFQGTTLEGDYLATGHMSVVLGSETVERTSEGPWTLRDISLLETQAGSLPADEIPPTKRSPTPSHPSNSPP